MMTAKCSKDGSGILLSICIPTYNSSNHLRNALNSIVKQDGFDQRCEIVISDNNSSDDTAQMVHNEFVCQYNNIRYYSNNTNIGDENFIKVMNYAEGKYIKLHSDKWCFIDHKLSDLLNHLDQSEHNVICLLNKDSNSTHAGAIQCNDFNEFVSIVSYLCTWITGMIYKKSSYENLKDKERYVSLQLAQTDILFRLLRNGSSLIIDGKILTEQPREPRGGYNFFEVFICNYLSLYDDYLNNGLLNPKTYKMEKAKLLKYHILPWYTEVILMNSRKHKFHANKDANKIILKYFGYKSLLFMLPVYIIKSVLRTNLVKMYRLISPQWQRKVDSLIRSANGR